MTCGEIDTRGAGLPRWTLAFFAIHTPNDNEDKEIYTSTADDITYSITSMTHCAGD
jgi:hypothetical protein